LLILNSKLAKCFSLHTAGVASSKLASPTKYNLPLLVAKNLGSLKKILFLRR
jgi:hypothetical protein